MTNSVHVFAPAKINLFLHVGDKRADGFHPLESLAVFVDVGDELTIERSSELSLSLDGPFAEGLQAESDNLVLRAARALNATGCIALTKNLPVASGIGGGSADAAAALRGLNQLYGLNRTDLETVAATLGSDVPVCVGSQSAWMQGRGEILTPAAVPPLAMVLVNPRVGVSTAEVFRTLKSRSGIGRDLTLKGDLLPLLKSTTNDLEAPARAIQPVIGNVLDALGAAPNAQLARMSGSGATCFGVFSDEASAGRAARYLSGAHPTWWVRAANVLQ
ncbi:MAG TPA: 4-(cytidine 5'-diphospho)-2-C-methyl-D-erythritol kinase [Rhizomicrobium sp.]|nr:4-(cytidine 5'-diphospho)-2-C-methyl-D-erythritol kinase [Rhizomicrobium sp.]